MTRYPHGAYRQAIKEGATTTAAKKRARRLRNRMRFTADERRVIEAVKSLRNIS